MQIRLAEILKSGLFCLLMSGLLLSCNSGEKMAQGDGMSWKNKLKVADRFFEQGYYYDAANYYEDVITLQPDNVDVMYKLADSYYYGRDYKTAQTYYKQVVDNNVQLYPIAHYRYALTLKMNGKFDEAKTEFKSFIKGYRAYDAPVYKKMVKNEIAGCDFAKEALNNPLNVVVVHIGNEINAGYTEASPLPVDDDRLMFSSLRSDTLLVTDNIKEKTGRFRLYESAITRQPGRVTIDEGSEGQKKWGNGEPLPKEINVPGKDVANGTFSPDGKKFYFTQCEADKTGKMICAIYVSDYENEKYSNVKVLPETINIPGYTSTHPTLAKFKKGSQLLYFVSNMPDGVGGLDIWYSEITKSGEIKPPRNAGKKINTVGDELTPFYNNNSKILYFSSNGHPSMGGYDVFTTVGRQRKWTKPENVGFPLNSTVDDMYFVADGDEEGGYFVSNRKGTIALKSETCCDDIFRYNWDRDYIPKFAVQGFAYNEDDSTKTSFKDYEVKLYQIDRDSTEILINEAYIVDERLFLFPLKQNKNYKLVALKDGYFPNDATVSTMGLKRSDTLFREIPLKKLELNQSIVLKDVYYDFDKSTLREESNNTLSRLVEILNSNPGIIVE